jgi:hypothetical protein
MLPICIRQGAVAVAVFTIMKKLHSVQMHTYCKAIHLQYTALRLHFLLHLHYVHWY